MKKKIWLILCMALCIFAMAACGKNEDTGTGKAEFTYDASALKMTTMQYLQSWNVTDFSQLVNEDTLNSYGEQIYNNYVSWTELQDILGSFLQTEKTTLEETDTTVEVVIRSKYESGLMDFRMVFDEAGNVLDIIAEKHDTLGEKMEKAGLNTLMGISIVFFALIFMTFVIWLLRFVPVLQQKFSRKPEAAAVETKGIDHAIANIAEQEEEDLTDDLELAAVITAAIMASMGEEAPADGLVVRSIRKRNQSKNWQNA